MQHGNGPVLDFAYNLTKKEQLQHNWQLFEVKHESTYKTAY